MALSPKQTAALKTYLRAFLAAAVAVLALQLKDGSSIDWTAVLYAGVTAILGPIVRWLDPTETAYGRGSE